MPRRITPVVVTLALLAMIDGSPAAAQPAGLVRLSEAPNGNQANGESGGAEVSNNGLVVFSSSASNIAPDDTNGTVDVFLYDAKVDVTTLLSRDRRSGPAKGASSGPDISASGRYVAFASSASDLVENDDNGFQDIFVLDRETGVTELVSVRKSGVQGDGHSFDAHISAGGRYVAFSSRSKNLSRLPDTNRRQDVFVHDRRTGTTNRVSVSSEGEEADEHSYAIGVSADGRRVAYLSFASNLVPNDTNRFGDAFVYDREKQKTIRASVSTDGRQSTGGGIATDISSDGRYVLFYTDAGGLVPGDMNETDDVFVRDLVTRTTERVSVATGGIEANAYSHNEAQISHDGCLVTFDSGASNLVSGDTNNRNDIFVRDRCEDETTRVSEKPDGTEANESSARPSISPDGSRVAFATEATNLAGPDTNEVDEVFLATR